MSDFQTNQAGLSHYDPDLLVNRERFAVNLRKQKKAKIINQSRLKLDIHPLTYQFNSSDANMVDQLCANVMESLLNETDILPSLTELRRLLSNN